MALIGAAAGRTLAKLLVEAVRRRHDMGVSAPGALVSLALGVIAVIGTFVYALGTDRSDP